MADLYLEAMNEAAEQVGKRGYIKRSTLAKAKIAIAMMAETQEKRAAALVSLEEFAMKKQAHPGRTIGKAQPQTVRLP